MSPSTSNDLNLDISVPSLLIAVSGALDNVHPTLQSHQKRVCVIACKLAQFLKFNDRQYKDIFLSAIIHDIGALALDNRINLLKFEEVDTQIHCQMGSKLIEQSVLLKHLSPAILYHHHNWENGKHIPPNIDDKFLLAQLIHISDRVEVLCHEENILAKAESIRKLIKSHISTKFYPAYVEAFLEISQKDAFWFELGYEDLDYCLQKLTPLESHSVNSTELEGLTKFISLIIDSRSHFTSTHSSGVASCSEMLSKLMGLSKRSTEMIRIAGYLHDIGKLSIPTELLEKPGSLTHDERALVKAHIYKSYQILREINGLEEITQIAIAHHERIDGSGYPFGKKGENLSLLQRIMGVADVFTALNENRPYRPNKSKEEIMNYFEAVVKENLFDKEVVACLKLNYETIKNAVDESQHQAKISLKDFWQVSNE